MSNHQGYQRLAAVGDTNWVPSGFDKHFDRPQTHDPVLEDYIRLWELRLRGMRNDATRLKPNSCMELRYEDLLLNPSSQITKLSQFLELNRIPSMVSQICTIDKG